MALILMLIGTLLSETSSSMGKNAVNNHSETVYSFGFLSLFWSVVFFGVTGLVLSDFVFDIRSLPLFTLRLILEIILAHIALTSIVLANRSTVSFLKLVTIPLLLLVDLAVGYSIALPQIFGIFLILAALMTVFWHNPSDKKGSMLVLTASVIAVATTSLFKYNITYYNSVAAEQLIVSASLLIYFTIMSIFVGKERPWKLLSGFYTEVQSITHGIAGVLLSFAYIFAPASIIITMKRSLSILWSIIFGQRYFHEQNLARKLIALPIVVIGLILISM